MRYLLAIVLFALLFLTARQYDPQVERPGSIDLSDHVRKAREASILLEHGAVRVYEDSTGRMIGVFRRPIIRDDSLGITPTNTN